MSVPRPTPLTPLARPKASPDSSLVRSARALPSSLFVALLCTTSLVGACSHGAAQAKEVVSERATPVRLASIERGHAVRTLHAVGRVHLKDEVSLAFKVGGIVTAMSVDEGSRVRKGQLLATLDQAEVAHGVARAREVRSKAARDLERAKHLHSAGSLALTDLQNAETALALAATDAQSADFNLVHSRIVAPYAGVVEAREAEVGEIVAPGQPVLRLFGRGSETRVRAAVSEGEAVSLGVGERARVALSAAPKDWVSARIDWIASTVDPATGTVDVDFIFESPTKSVPVGLSARVEIDLDEPRVRALVPVGALVEGADDQASVYVVRAQRAIKLPVTVGFFADTRVALLGGLEGESFVVDRGAEQLADGALVRVVP